MASRKRTLEQDYVICLENSEEMSKELESQATLVACAKKKPVVIFVPDTQQWTVANIKEEVEKKIGIPARDQVIYCNEKVLPEQLPLVDCEGMRNGAALLVGRKPFIVNVYRTDADITIPIEISHIDSLRITELREMIFAKVGIPSSCPSVILAVGDHIIEDSTALVLNSKHIQNGCVIVLTYLKGISLSFPASNENTYVHVPFSASLSFMANRVFPDRAIAECATETKCKVKYKWGWVLNILPKDGPMIAVEVPQGMLTPVDEVKQLVYQTLSIVTYKQVLTAGKEILEDYDDDGQYLLLCNYPAAHDRAMLHLTTSKEGIHVITEAKQAVISPRHLCYSLHEDTVKSIKTGKQINISNPGAFSIQKLRKVLGDCITVRACGKKINDDGIAPNASVAAIPWIRNGTQFTRW